MEYTVLWFDDEHENFDEHKVIAAADYNINLEGFSNSEEGLKELSANLNLYDAILLDGRFYYDSTQKGNDIDSTGIVNVIKFLSKEKKNIPCFIYSGQQSFFEDKDILKNYSELFVTTKVFDKATNGDFEILMETIVETIKRKDTYKAKKEHSKAFELCKKINESLDSSDSINLFFKLFISERDYFERYNIMRKMMEELFLYFKQLKIVPALNFNEIAYFLEEKHRDYQYNRSLDVHPTIIYLLKNIIPLLQEGSHSLKDRTNDTTLTNEIRFVEFCKNFPKNNYIHSIYNQMFLQLFTYFNDYITNHQDITENISKWSPKEIENDKVEGNITSKNDQYLFVCTSTRKTGIITAKMILDKNLKIGDCVYAIVSDHNNNPEKWYFIKDIFKKEKQ